MVKLGIETGRLTPAWAGSTRRRPQSPSRRATDPRVGGEHA